jgi:hypothetical protein
MVNLYELKIEKEKTMAFVNFSILGSYSTLYVVEDFLYFKQHF